MNGILRTIQLELRISQLQTLFLLCIGRFLALFVKEKNLWLICERGTDARDNGYWLFRYIKTSHPEINAKYLITRDSEDRKKLLLWEKDIIEYKSITHYILIWKAYHLISTHACGYLPTSIRTTKLFKKLFNVCNNSAITWLAHGIKKDSCSGYYAKNNRLDLFVCGALPEFNFIHDNFGHPDGVVQYTGLARFDQLHDVITNDKQILFMPTWRLWLNDEVFTESEYFKTISLLLSSQELHGILRKNNLKLVFYPHYEIQPHISEFKKLKLPDNIIIADKEQFDVQQLLKESALLITDYSSVFFDFAYMKKPIIYFQFDEKKFREGHYPEGYYDYHNGLGEWTNNITDLSQKLEQLVANKFKMPQKYLDQVDAFFPLNDTNNCERIYNAILACSKKQQ